MRKIDVVILIVLSALGASVWRSRLPQGGVEPTSTPALTRSGRWEVLSGPFSVAGLRMGASEASVLEALGQPREKRQENAETSQWVYANDGSELILTLLEGRLVAAIGLGRWALTMEGKPLPAFLASREELRAALGQPDRTEATGAYGEGAWIFTRRPGELTYHFEKEMVTQFSVTGEVKPLPR